MFIDAIKKWWNSAAERAKAVAETNAKIEAFLANSGKLVTVLAVHAKTDCHCLIVRGVGTERFVVNHYRTNSLPIVVGDVVTLDIDAVGGSIHSVYVVKIHQ